MKLNDEELKSCYFSRQKIVYAREVAKAIISGKLSLKKLANSTDDEVRTKLKKLKGIGDWTADVFLMMALNRCDCFPAGDVALIKSMKEEKRLPATLSKDEMLNIAYQWRPYRTIAAYLLWHAYLQKKKGRKERAAIPGN